ncbi:hypothetical protein D3C85_1052910 [compost metagenome]
MEPGRFEEPRLFREVLLLMQWGIAPALQGVGLIGQARARGHGPGRHDGGHVQRRQGLEAGLVHADGFGRQGRIIGGGRRQPTSEGHFVGDQQVRRQLADPIGDALPGGAFRRQIDRPFHHANPHTSHLAFTAIDAPRQAPGTSIVMRARREKGAGVATGP